MWTIVMGIALALGGVWLQNTYQTILRIQEQQAEFTRFADTKFIDRDYMQEVQKTTERRLMNIEGKIDHLLDMAVKGKPLTLPHDQQ